MNALAVTAHLAGLDSSALKALRSLEAIRQSLEKIDAAEQEQAAAARSLELLSGVAKK